MGQIKYVIGHIQYVIGQIQYVVVQIQYVMHIALNSINSLMHSRITLLTFN